IQLRTYRADNSRRPGSELLVSLRALFTDSEDQNRSDPLTEASLSPDDLYTRDLSRYPRMPQEETLECLLALGKIGTMKFVGKTHIRDVPEEQRATYERLRERLILGHHRLCYHVLERFGFHRRTVSLSREDLIQEGLFGLARA